MLNSGRQGRASPGGRALANAATFLALLSVTALLLGALGRWFWPFDLLAHARVHCAAVLFAAALVFAALRNWQSAAIALLAMLLAAVPLLDYLMPARAASVAAAAEPTLKALSFNIWFRNDDPNRLVEYLDASGADIVVLQEMSEDEGRALHAHLTAYPHAYLEGAGSSDTVLFSRWPIRDATVVPLAEDAVGALCATIEWRDRQITVVGVHLHWPLGGTAAARRNAELAALAAIAQLDEAPLIVLGDFNITPWSAHFRRFVESSGLADCSLGHGLNPTWPSQALLFGIRIDHCFVSPQWRALDARVGPALGSDHRPLWVELTLQ